MLKKLLFIISMIFIMIFNGCWDRRELETLGLVQALGIDAGLNGKGITVTAMIAIPPKISGGGQSGGGGGGGAETGVFTISMNAPTIYEAFNLLNTTINREISLIQNSAILIGEDVAKEGLGKWADTFLRFREMRRTVLVYICKGKAAEIMKVQPKLEKNPSEYFIDLTRLSNLNGMFPLTSLNDFMVSFETYGQEIYIPLLEKYQPEEPGQPKKGTASDTTGQTSGDKKTSGGGESSPSATTTNIRVVGTAVFKGDKMIGTLDNYESQVLMLLTGRFHEAMLSLPDPDAAGEYVAFRLLATQGPTIKYTHPENNDRFSVKLNLEADIVSIQSGENYTIPSEEKRLGKLIAGSLEKRVKKVVAKVQQQYKSDIFGLGNTARASFVTSTAWHRYNWPKRFPSAEINTKVKVALRRVGVQFQPPELK